MSGHSEFSETPIEPRRLNPGVAALDRVFDRINAIVMLFCAVALVAAAVVLTESVFVRYFLHATTDWQDEATVFLLVGATFMSTAYVQSQRGHVGIGVAVGPEAVAVVAHVDRHHLPVGGHPSRDCPPVSRRAEQPVHDQ